jgi:RNA polymerase subunit RPABC4/transcription elongation factor Spt4
MNIDNASKISWLEIHRGYWLCWLRRPLSVHMNGRGVLSLWKRMAVVSSVGATEWPWCPQSVKTNVRGVLSRCNRMAVVSFVGVINGRCILSLCKIAGVFSVGADECPGCPQSVQTNDWMVLSGCWMSRVSSVSANEWLQCPQQVLMNVRGVLSQCKWKDGCPQWVQMNVRGVLSRCKRMTGVSSAGADECPGCPQSVQTNGWSVLSGCRWTAGMSSAGADERPDWFLPSTQTQAVAIHTCTLVLSVVYLTTLFTI